MKPRETEEDGNGDEDGRVRSASESDGDESRDGNAGASQGVGEAQGCGHSFGEYFCAPCRLWESGPTALLIFHCAKCGVCRKRATPTSELFHCDVCACCLDVSVRDTHVCRPNTLDLNCALCWEHLSTSTRPSMLGPFCGHALHQHCFEEFARNGSIKCPTCGKPLVDISALSLPRRTGLKCLNYLISGLNFCLWLVFFVVHVLSSLDGWMARHIAWLGPVAELVPANKGLRLVFWSTLLLVFGWALFS